MRQALPRTSGRASRRIAKINAVNISRGSSAAPLAAVSLGQVMLYAEKFSVNLLVLSDVDIKCWQSRLERWTAQNSREQAKRLFSALAANDKYLTTAVHKTAPDFVVRRLAVR